VSSHVELLGDFRQGLGGVEMAAPFSSRVERVLQVGEVSVEVDGHGTRDAVLGSRSLPRI
jgi:hypothetical protein